jgi:hypothetical protein
MNAPRRRSRPSWSPSHDVICQTRTRNAAGAQCHRLGRGTPQEPDATEYSSVSSEHTIVPPRRRPTAAQPIAETRQLAVRASHFAIYSVARRLSSASSWV